MRAKKRRLELAKETVRELTAPELGRAGGADNIITPATNVLCPTFPVCPSVITICESVQVCDTDFCTDDCPTVNCPVTA